MQMSTARYRMNTKIVLSIAQYAKDSFTRGVVNSIP